MEDEIHISVSELLCSSGLCPEAPFFSRSVSNLSNTATVKYDGARAIFADDVAECWLSDDGMSIPEERIDKVLSSVREQVLKGPSVCVSAY